MTTVYWSMIWISNVPMKNSDNRKWKSGVIKDTHLIFEKYSSKTIIYFHFQVINCYYETWIFGPLMCEIYALCGSIFGCGSIWSLCMIAFDRYNVIVKGLSAKPLTINGSLLRILGIWLMASIWTFAPMMGWNR